MTGKILIDRAVVEQALGALEKYADENYNGYNADGGYARRVGATLRAALAEQPAEQDWQTQAVQYQRREIGEGDWMDCTKEQYENAQERPEMDTRVITNPLAEQAPVATKTAGGAYDGITLHLGWDNIPGGTKLYAAPQPAKQEPLTEDDLFKAWGDYDGEPANISWADFNEVAQYIIAAYERKNGITKE